MDCGITCREWGHQYNGGCLLGTNGRPFPKSEEIVEGKGDVTFHLVNGDSFTLKDINFDDISPVGANKECISAESFDGQTIYHIPFVRYWTVSY